MVKTRIALPILCLLVHSPSLGEAASPTVCDPVEIVDQAAVARGQRSHVLVLGTGHLSDFPKGFDWSRFEPLIDRLGAWKPDAIAIEALSGTQCDYLRMHSFAFPGTADTYCFDPTPARTSLGLSGAEAEEQVEGMLANTHSPRTSSERRKLAALFLATGEPASAVVQWLQLSPAERIADDGLTDALIETLKKQMSLSNENIVIAAAMAVRLDLDRVYPVDDHTGDRASGIGDDELFETEMSAIWDNPAVRTLIENDEAWQLKLATGENIIAWYGAINSAEAQRTAMAADFAAAAASETPGNSGRRYLAYWETRNLRMVANLREVIGPGRRVLAIVGASHKPYYERYLRMTSDITIVNLEAVISTDDAPLGG